MYFTEYIIVGFSKKPFVDDNSSLPYNELLLFEKYNIKINNNNCATHFVSLFKYISYLAQTITTYVQLTVQKARGDQKYNDAWSILVLYFLLFCMY